MVFGALCSSSHDLGPFLLEAGIDFVHERLGDEVVGAFFDVPSSCCQDSQVLCEGSFLDCADNSRLQSLTEKSQLFVAVKLGAVAETTGPREDGSDWVGRGGTSLFPNSKVSGDSAVGSFSFHDIVLVDADGGHETEGAESLRNNVRLNVSIVVLASPDEATVALDDLSDQVIDESVLVVNALLHELLDVLLAVDRLERVLEESIVLLQDGVLSGKLEWHSTVQGVKETSVSELSNRLVRVEHTQVAATGLQVLNLLHSWCAAIIRLEDELDIAGLGDDIVLASVLVTESVSADDDWLCPSWHKSRDARDNDGLTEDGSVKDVSNRAVWRSPHLLESKFLNAFLVWGDRGALDSDLVLLDSVGTINGDLVVSGITRGDTQVVVLSFEIDVWVNVLQKEQKLARSLSSNSKPSYLLSP